MPRLPVADRRRRLVEAASAVLTREGIAGLTTRAVCAEAGMPQGAFHYCFASKDELLHELIEESVHAMLQRSRAAVTPQSHLESSLRAGLHAIWDGIVATPNRQLGLYELTTYALRHPEAAELARWQYKRYVEAAEEFLADVAQHAHATWVQPVSELAGFLVTVIDGMGLPWLATHDDIASRRTLDTLVGHLASRATARPV